MSLPALPWEDRPVEVANLLNPAFGAVVLRTAAAAFQRESGRGIPFALLFLILPVALHPPTRGRLPSTTRTHLHSWLEANAAIQVDTIQRVRRLAPYTREAILFAFQHGILAVEMTGDIVNARSRMRDPFEETSDAAAARDAARFLGSWFGKLGDPSFILTIWGIRP